MKMQEEIHWRLAAKKSLHHFPHHSISGVLVIEGNEGKESVQAPKGWFLFPFPSLYLISSLTHFPFILLAPPANVMKIKQDLR